MRPLSFAFALSLTALAHPAFAQANVDACLNQAGSTQAMVQCYDKSTRVEDARLNAAYEQLRAQTPEAQRNALRDVQRQWIKFRDADCGLLGKASGGTVDRVAGASCVYLHTSRRADDLEGRLTPR